MRFNGLSDFEKEWIEIFAKGISKTELEKHVLADGNYIWHIFSWELLPKSVYLEGDEARQAFDAQDKLNATYFEPWLGRKENTPICDSPLASDLDLRLECYVIAHDKTWTYIKTHEGDCCGPYFYKLISRPSRARIFHSYLDKINNV